MSRKLISKLLVILFAIGLFSYQLYPTFQFYSKSKEERKLLKETNKEEYDGQAKRAIKLGLDLQGGMHLVMEVDVKELLSKLATNKDANFETALAAAIKEVQSTDGDLIDAFNRKLKEAGSDLGLYYSSSERRSSADILAFLRSQAEESIDRSLEILRNRIDEFGVSEPTIQKQGANRIVIELAGVEDRNRARDLVGQTAKLEFRMLKEQEVMLRTARRINDMITGEAKPAADSSAAAGEATADATKDTSSAITADDIFGGGETTDSGSTAAADGAAESAANQALFLYTQGGLLIHHDDVLKRFDETMQSDETKKIINQEAGKAEFLIGKIPTNIESIPRDRRYIPVYLVNATPDLEGETITEASRQRSSLDDLGSTGWETNITFNSEGRDIFRRITGANIGKRMAIILDRKVQSAPTIQTKISQGRARITNLETAEEAENLAIVLKAGALPTANEIIEERSVGASLGEDSISQGLNSALLGLALVALFMLAYYKLGGVVANIALVLNIVILLGAMAGLGFTLTLPGIAGIILTIGMAVDANVLIFERIREELDKGKSSWVALDTGYGRAFITILDANVTTFIAGVVLFNFGTGPIRGFAVTLMIGILASMFTAIFVTRAIFELLLSKKMIKELSV